MSLTKHLVGVSLPEKSRSWLVVNWSLTNRCNYACSYCPSELHDGSLPTLSKEVIESFCKNVAETAKTRGQKPAFEFGGGEVTYLSYFPWLLELIEQLGGVVTIISNGSTPLAWWLENGPRLHNVALSYHHRQVRSQQHFHQVVSLLADSKLTHPHVNFMMDPEYFDDIFSFANNLREKVGCSMALQPLYHGFATGQSLSEFSYTQEQKDIMQNFSGRSGSIHKDLPVTRGLVDLQWSDGSKSTLPSHEVLIKGLSTFEGWECDAGLDNLVVNFQGDIFRAWCSEGGKIGSIYDSDLKLPKQSIICHRKLCQCGFDISSRKSAKSLRY